jgi:hypothetical protein
LASFRANENGQFVVGSYGSMHFRGSIGGNDSTKGSGVLLNSTDFSPEKVKTIALGTDTNP